MADPMSATVARFRAAAGRRRGGPVVDWWLAGAVGILVLLGLVMVASASIPTADRSTHEPLHLFWRQLVYLGIALPLGFGT